MCSVAQLCPTLGDPVDCGPAGSSVRGILLARILEQVPPPGDLPNAETEPAIPAPALAGEFFTTEPPGRPLLKVTTCTDLWAGFVILDCFWDLPILMRVATVPLFNCCVGPHWEKERRPFIASPVVGL